MIDEVERELKTQLNEELVEKLFETLSNVKKKYVLGDHRSCSLEAGRFAEVVFRILQFVTSRSYIPFGESISNFHDETEKFSQLNSSQFPASLRIHIPRALQVIYDTRNKRDVGHVGGEVDSNFMDATLSISLCNWVTGELLRLYYTSDINEATKLVNTLIKIQIPIVQEFEGVIKILDPSLSIPDKIVVLLYHKGEFGAAEDDLKRWIKQPIRTDYWNTTITKLEVEKALIHCDGFKCYITERGIRYVQDNIPLEVEL